MLKLGRFGWGFTVVEEFLFKAQPGRGKDVPAPVEWQVSIPHQLHADVNWNPAVLHRSARCGEFISQNGRPLWTLWLSPTSGVQGETDDCF